MSVTLHGLGRRCIPPCVFATRRSLVSLLLLLLLLGGAAPAAASDVEARVGGEIDRQVLEWLTWLEEGSLLDSPARARRGTDPARISAAATLIDPAEAVCFPTCTVDDGRMLTVLGGDALQSFIGSSLAFRLSAPSSTTVLRWGVFDGDSQGVWDFPADASSLLEFSVYADPDGTQDPAAPTGTPVQVVLGSAMDDDAWSDFEIDLTTTPQAQANAANASGDYVFLAVVQLSGTATDRDWNNFKLRSDQRLRIVTEPFAFTAPLFGADEGPILYPNGPTDPATTTYDGTWNLYLEQVEPLATLEVWDGDFDRGSWNGTDLDTDDPDTPNTVPAFATGTSAAAEGVADGNPATCTTQSSATGCPADDRSVALFARTATTPANGEQIDGASGTSVFQVPAGVSQITVKAWGGGGGGGAGDGALGADGGGGGYAGCTLTVTPGETLDVHVGGGGGGGATDSQAGEGGGGGGRSEISRGGTPLCVAGGGGGGGGGDDNSGGNGGAGGAGGGTSGVAGQDVGNGGGGGGGTQVAGGAGGTTNARVPGQPGAFRSGGDGGGGPNNNPTTNNAGGFSNGGDGGVQASPAAGGGGGGGSGYYGGGGGGTQNGGGNSGGGGGGGSSFLSGTATSTLAGSGRNPGNLGDPDRAGDAGRGGAGGATNQPGGAGEDGLVVLRWTATPTSTPIRYTVTAPDGQTTSSENPSGNREWERLVFPSGDGDDFPAGVFLVTAEGIDLSNLNAWKFNHDVCPVNALGEPVCSLCLDTIDFETDAQGNPLSAGDVLTNQWAAWGVSITTTSAGNPAMVYDSSCPGGCSGGDVDLGTPNECYGGPGVAGGSNPSNPGGPCGSGATNDSPLGNVMIISEDGDSSDPDDDTGGVAIVWTFDFPVFLERIEELDMELDTGTFVRGYDQFGTLLFEEEITGFGDNSFDSVTVRTGGVRRLVFDFEDSGAIPALVFCDDRVVDSQPEPSAAISGMAFRDSDGDGAFEAAVGELALSGRTVTLEGEGNRPLARTLTDRQGRYQFQRLSADVYGVRLEPDPGVGTVDRPVSVADDQVVGGVDLASAPPSPVRTWPVHRWLHRPWPTPTLVLGDRELSREPLRRAMRWSRGTSRSIDLLGQAVAAKLNVGAGAASGCVEEALLAADRWLTERFFGDSRPQLRLDREGRDLTLELRRFNAGGCP